MSTIRILQVLALAAVFAGCGTYHAVREARSAQKAYADRGIGAEARTEKIDLKGCNLAQLVDFGKKVCTIISITLPILLHWLRIII